MRPFVLTLGVALLAFGVTVIGMGIGWVLSTPGVSSTFTIAVGFVIALIGASITLFGFLSKTRDEITEEALREYASPSGREDPRRALHVQPRFRSR